MLVFDLPKPVLLSRFVLRVQRYFINAFSPMQKSYKCTVIKLKFSAGVKNHNTYLGVMVFIEIKSKI